MPPSRQRAAAESAASPDTAQTSVPTTAQATARTTAPVPAPTTWTDLTRAVRTGMPVYPGDPAVHLAPARRLADDGVAVTHLSLGSHTGTHVDAPAHLVPGGRTVDRLRLDELTGETLVLGFEGLPADAVITAGMVAGLLGRGPHVPDGVPGRVPARVLVATGWDADFEDAGRRLHHPVVSAGAAELLWDAGARLLGVDTLSPDPTVPQGQAGFPVHEMFLVRDGVLVENLAGLTGLSGLTDRAGTWSVTVWFGVFPLMVQEGDGAPARAVAQPWPGPTLPPTTPPPSRSGSLATERT